MCLYHLVRIFLRSFLSNVYVLADNSINFSTSSETSNPPSDENKPLNPLSVTNKPVEETAKMPLLGYDWIAANMDNQSEGPCHVSAVEMPDDVIREIAEFRNSHKRECQSRGSWDLLVKTPKNAKVQLAKLPEIVRSAQFWVLIDF